VSWEDVFEIPLPPKLKIFQNSTLEAFQIFLDYSHMRRIIRTNLHDNYSTSAPSCITSVSHGLDMPVEDQGIISSQLKANIYMVSHLFR
jgi:hypothetical protein